MPDLLNPIWDAEINTGDGAFLRAVRLAKHAGATRLAANLYELDPGTVVSPLHFHHRNEELLLVLSGAPSIRRGGGVIEDLAAGAVVSFPVGQSGEHQILNRSGYPARVLVCATDDKPEIAEQTEANQLAIITDHGLRLTPRTSLVQAP
jgi:uncharacterized cupin superfamily protein